MSAEGGQREEWEHNGRAGREQVSIRRRRHPDGTLELTLFTPGRRYRAAFIELAGRRVEGALVELLAFDSHTHPVAAVCRLLGGEGDPSEARLRIPLEELVDAR